MNYIVYNDFRTCTPAIISEDAFSSLDEPNDVFYAESFQELYEIILDYKPKGTVPVIICYPLKEAVITFVTPELSTLQRVVGGNIEIINLPDFPDVDIICNEDGKINKMRLNRGLHYKNTIFDVVAGPMIIMGVNEGVNVGLTYSQMEKVYYKFLEPEVFIINKKENTITSVKCSPSTAEIMRENNISIIG